MPIRTASCACGQLTAVCSGEPVRVSVCHCLACQQRSGSAFAIQARWPKAQVLLRGETKTWQRVGDAGGRATHLFCPVCGSTLAYMVEACPGLIAVAVGAFADPSFPPPAFSVYEERKHGWLEVTGAVEHSA